MAKTYTNEEMREILQDFTVRKIQAFEQEIIKLRKREELRTDLKKAEVAKAVIPPHRHNSGLSVGSGVEDIPAAAINQNDNVHPVKKEELCKECGKSHELGKACMSKSAISDKIQEGADEQIEETSVETSAEEIKAPGSGGQIKRGPKVMKKSAELKANLKKSTKDMIEASKGTDLKKFQDGIKKVALLRLEVEALEKNAVMGYGGAAGAPDAGAMGMPGAMKAEPNPGEGCKRCGGSGRIHQYDDSAHKKHSSKPCPRCKGNGEEQGLRTGVKPNQLTDISDWKPKAEKAEPPMAKPPSGKNMNTHVPSSKPMAPPKMAGAPAMKDELEKGVMADIARQNQPPGPATAPEPKMPLPTPDQQAGRAESFHAASQGAFQPKAPVVSGLQLQPKKPGIFGRIGNK